MHKRGTIKITEVLIKKCGRARKKNKFTNDNDRKYSGVKTTHELLLVTDNSSSINLDRIKKFMKIVPVIIKDHALRQ